MCEQKQMLLNSTRTTNRQRLQFNASSRMAFYDKPTLQE